MIKAFLQDESGATAIEYGMIAALIALTIIGTIAATGTSVLQLFNTPAVPTLDAAIIR
jgi:pilus assembly protein Flp/PilA